MEKSPYKRVVKLYNPVVSPIAFAICYTIYALIIAGIMFLAIYLIKKAKNRKKVKSKD